MCDRDTGTGQDQQERDQTQLPPNGCRGQNNPGIGLGNQEQQELPQGCDNSPDLDNDEIDPTCWENWEDAPQALDEPDALVSPQTFDAPQRYEKLAKLDTTTYEESVGYQNYLLQQQGGCAQFPEAAYTPSKHASVPYKPATTPYNYKHASAPARMATPNNKKAQGPPDTDGDQIAPKGAEPQDSVIMQDIEDDIVNLILDSTTTEMLRVAAEEQLTEELILQIAAEDARAVEAEAAEAAAAAEREAAAKAALDEKELPARILADADYARLIGMDLESMNAEQRYIISVQNKPEFKKRFENVKTLAGEDKKMYRDMTTALMQKETREELNKKERDELRTEILTTAFFAKNANFPREKITVNPIQRKNLPAVLLPDIVQPSIMSHGSSHAVAAALAKQYETARKEAQDKYSCEQNEVCRRITLQQSGVGLDLVATGCDVQNIDVCTLIQHNPGRRVAEIAGLHNPSNFCFANSTLQTLFRRRLLAQHAVDIHRLGRPSGNADPLYIFLVQLHNIVRLMTTNPTVKAEIARRFQNEFYRAFHGAEKVLQDDYNDYTADNFPKDVPINYIGNRSISMPLQFDFNMISGPNSSQSQQDAGDFETKLLFLMLSAHQRFGKYQLRSGNGLLDNMPPMEVLQDAGPFSIDFLNYFEKFGGFYSTWHLFGQGCADFATINYVLFGVPAEFSNEISRVNMTIEDYSRDANNVAFNELVEDPKNGDGNAWLFAMLKYLNKMEACETLADDRTSINEFAEHLAQLHWFVHLRRYSFSPLLHRRFYQFVEFTDCGNCNAVLGLKVRMGPQLNLGALETANLFGTTNREFVSMRDCLAGWSINYGEREPLARLCSFCKNTTQTSSRRRFTRLPTYMTVIPFAYQSNTHHIVTPYKNIAVSAFTMTKYLLKTIRERLTTPLEAHTVGVVVRQDLQDNRAHYVALVRTRHITHRGNKLTLPKPGCWFTYNDHTVSVNPSVFLRDVVLSHEVVSKGRMFMLKIGKANTTHSVAQLPTGRPDFCLAARRRIFKEMDSDYSTGMLNTNKIAVLPELAWLKNSVNWVAE